MVSCNNNEEELLLCQSRKMLDTKNVTNTFNATNKSFNIFYDTCDPWTLMSEFKST